MSKIIDALEKVREFTRGGSSEPDPTMKPDPRSRPNSYQATQEELADVYFSRSGKAQPALPGPTVVRVVDRRASYFWPWIVTTAALMLTAFALLFSGRVDVNIRMAGEEGAAEAPRVLKVTGPAIPLASEDFYFSEAASANSKTGRELRISGSELPGPVYAALKLNPPFNARDHVLEFEAKGEAGGENVEVLFSDVKRQTSLNQGTLRPFPAGLTTAWQKASVSVTNAEGFDASRVVLLRIGTGSRAGSAAAGTVQIRNLKWRSRPKAS